MEKAILDIKELNITQGMNGSYSHNGDKAIYLDGIHVAEAWSPVTSDDIANAPAISLREDPNLDHNYVYVSSVIRVPGSGQEHVLNPGESFLVATNAINFKEEVRTAAAEYGLPVDQTMIDHIIDLSTADMETYMRKRFQLLRCLGFKQWAVALSNKKTRAQKF